MFDGVKKDVQKYVFLLESIKRSSNLNDMGFD